MRSPFAVALSLAFFLSTLDAQTFAQNTAQPGLSRAQAAVNLSGLWEIVDKDEVAAPQIGVPREWQLNRPKKTLRIALNAPWTDTGIKLAHGQPFSVAASGRMNWYTGGCPGGSANCTVTPQGRPWSVCAGFGDGFIAPNLNCWSLIGRVGDGPAFEVGGALNNFSVESSGELFLGVNDAEGGFADNTGEWNTEITLNAGVKRFLIAPAARGFSMCVTEDGMTCLPHTTLAGSFASDRSRLRLVTTFTSNDPEAYLTVLDPDHLGGPRGVYIRSIAGAYDAPCDVSNSSHVTGEFAAMRARDAMHHYKDDVSAACWMRIAAEGGDARAQALMAFFAHEGEGVPKNLADAEEWAQKSADRKDAFGEIMLGLMVENKEVRFQNPILGQGVIDRAYAQINRIRQQQGLAAIRQPNQQKSTQGSDPRAVGAVALGIMLVGALAAMGSSSSGNYGSKEDAWRGEYDRREQMHRENDAACDGGNSAACGWVGRSAPDPQ